MWSSQRSGYLLRAWQCVYVPVASLSLPSVKNPLSRFRSCWLTDAIAKRSTKNVSLVIYVAAASNHNMRTAIYHCRDVCDAAAKVYRNAGGALSALTSDIRLVESLWRYACHMNERYILTIGQYFNIRKSTSQQQSVHGEIV